MKTTDAPSHIEGVALSKVELVIGGAGDMSMKVKANLVSRKGDIHGTTERVGGWTEPVLDAIRNLNEALEAHLLAANFDVGEDDDRSAERDTPKGILGT